MELKTFLGILLAFISDNLVNGLDSTGFCSQNNSSFQCTANGRFQVPNDTSCRSYYYCYELDSGEFSQTLYNCSFGLFNPNTQSCDYNYECPCTEVESTTITTTGSSSTCDASIDAIFNCSANGMYRNPSDFSCKQYYYCYKLRNGTFSQTLYTCSVGWFNAETQACDVSYECPCSDYQDTTSTEVISTTSAKNTTLTVTTSSTEISTSCTTETNFTCSSNGRFQDPSDLTCQSYFYCYKLGNGTFIQTTYSCSIGLFNPHSSSCDSGYVCPCSSDSSIYTTQPTTSGDSEETSTVSNSTLRVSTTESTTLFTTEATPGTTENSATCDSTANFTCSANGRFQNPSDILCESYYYCYKLRNGTFSQTLYTCSIGLFNPHSSSCDSGYVCSCSSDSSIYTTQPTTSGDSEETSTVSNSTLRVSTTESTTLFTTEATPGTTENSATCDSTANFTCSANGRFQNPSDILCESYYYCYKLRNGTFSQTLYTCSIGLFNPHSSSCDSGYVCSCSSDSSIYTTQPTTSGDSEETSTVSNSTLRVSTTESTTLFTTEATPGTTENSATCDSTANFTCSANGRFQNPSDILCESYYYCYKLRNGTFSQTLYTCSIGLFNPHSSSCDSGYVCSCSSDSSIYTTQPTTSGDSEETSTVSNSTLRVSTTESTTLFTTEATPGTTENSATCDSTANFTCSANGRFQNPSDILCKSYYYCYKLRNGTFSQTLYTCSIGLFNPDISVCDYDYVCLCLTTSVTSTTQSSASNNTSEITSEYSDTTTTDMEVDTNISDQTTSTEINGLASTSDIPISNEVSTVVDNNATRYYTTGISESATSTEINDITSTTDISNEVTTEEDSPITDADSEETTIGGISESVTSTDADDEESTTDDTAMTNSSTEEEYLTNTTNVGSDETSITVTDESVTSSSETSEPELPTSGKPGHECGDSGNQTFSCMKNGRFVDLADMTCTSYYLCHKPEGKSDFIQKRYTCCPGYFDPKIRGCVEEYMCPCNSYTS